MRHILFLLPFVLMLGAIIAASVYGISKQDKIDCDKWAAQSSVYSAFFITQNQKDQCDYFKINIKAPVK